MSKKSAKSGVRVAAIQALLQVANSGDKDVIALVRDCLEDQTYTTKAVQQAALDLLVHSSTDYEIVIDAVRLKGSSLAYASEEFKRNEAIVQTAVRQDGLALQHASEEMCNNEAVVRAAIFQNGRALRFASLALQDLVKVEQDFMAKILAERDGCALEQASEHIKNCEAIVLTSVQQRGAALNHASINMKGKKTVVMAAVQQDGLAIQYASKELKNDKAIVLAAVTATGIVLKIVSKEMKNDPHIVMAAVQENGLALEHASKEMKNDEPIVMAAIKQNAVAFQFASNEVRKSEAFVLPLEQKGFRLLGRRYKFTNITKVTTKSRYDARCVEGAMVTVLRVQDRAAEYEVKWESGHTDRVNKEDLAMPQG